jgi:hypothetical protein
VSGPAFGGAGVEQERSAHVEQERTAYCGTDPASGLGVLTAGDVDCGAALQVAAGYTKVWHGRAGAPVEVRTAGAVWKCQERQGDPNPYQECVNSADSGGRVTLSS